MSFIAENFSPVGDQARTGNTPAIYSYKTEDLLQDVLSFQYFDDLRGIIKINDWVYVTSGIGGTVTQEILFFSSDGIGVGANVPFAISNGGTGYSPGDIVRITYVDGTILRPTLLEVLLAPATIVTLLLPVDPGLMDPSDLPVTLTGLPTEKLTGSGDNALTVGPALTNSPTISIYPQQMNASA